MATIGIDLAEVTGAAARVKGVSSEIGNQVSTVQTSGTELKSDAQQIRMVNDRVNSELARITASRAALDEQLSSLRAQVAHISSVWQGAGHAGFQNLADRWQAQASSANEALENWKVRANEMNNVLADLQVKSTAMNAALDEWANKANAMNATLLETGQKLDEVVAVYGDTDSQIGAVFNG